jgi:MoaA/NifB/PqqE/SkfB family radical SAM enzyme/protein-L-isoaspartate O-methyltransferase
MKGDVFFTEIAARPPFTRLSPPVAAFFKDYLAHEKVIRFRGQYVVNTNFPPYPSGAFDNLVEQFGQLGEAQDRRLYSVTWAVTNRCPYHCWHCYNAGRSQDDLPLPVLERVAGELSGLGAVMVTLTGGEPLLRDDLEALAGRFGERSCLIVGTTGAGLTAERARRLREGGVFGVGISLDSTDPEEHDRWRGQPGAFRTALEALRIAGEEGLYPYVVAVATRQFLEPERRRRFLRFAAAAGALEVHLLEPSATGRLAERADVLLSPPERQQVLDCQAEAAEDDTLPIVSAFTYLESPNAFGCGAGLTHIYLDGSGELCPCNLVPLSFGNVAREPLVQVLERMGAHFCKPRPGCVGRLLVGRVPEGPLPTPPAVSAELCERYLPKEHALPRFFRVRSESVAAVGREELRQVYDQVHGDYEEFWLSQAAGPIRELVGQLSWQGGETVFEAGCGSGYGTALLARRADAVVAADLSIGMLAEARQRLRREGRGNVQFLHEDALAALQREGPFDVVFSSWVLGYIPLRPFFTTAARALRAGGQVAFVVHKENSPREALEIFAQLVARDPAVMIKKVSFDFPRDVQQAREELVLAGLEVVRLWEGAVVFRYASAEMVLEHLLKSGAGTAYYEAIDASRRAGLEGEFVKILRERHPACREIDVVHDYVACVARRP